MFKTYAFNYTPMGQARRGILIPMTDALGDILGKREQTEPPEFTEIRTFIRDKFDASCQLQMQNGQIIITVTNSALAGSLQFELHNLEEKLSGKKLRIRIG